MRPAISFSFFPEVAKLTPGDVLVLENLRFYPHEGSKDKDQRLEMAKKLASYADLYVSDAFGTAHRDAASMTGVPEVNTIEKKQRATEHVCV